LHNAPDKDSQNYQDSNGKDDPEKIADYPVWKKDSGNAVHNRLGDKIYKPPERGVNVKVSKKGDHPKDKDYNKETQYPGKNSPHGTEQQDQYSGDADSAHLPPGKKHPVNKRKKGQGDKGSKVDRAVFKKTETAEPVKVGIADMA
jgi:hypothetical protein